MKKSEFENNLDTLNSDQDKFTTPINEQTENVETKNNVIASKQQNKLEMVYKNLTRVGVTQAGICMDSPKFIKA